jgi:hypothetical protein
MRLDTKRYFTLGHKAVFDALLWCDLKLLAHFWCVITDVWRANPLWHNDFPEKKLGTIPAEQGHRFPILGKP